MQMEVVMKKFVFLLVAFCFVVGMSGIAEATDLNFWLNAWNDEEQPEWIGAGFITFRIIFYDEFGPVGDPIDMEYAGAGALYWRTIDSDEFTLQGGDWFGANSWSVDFVGGNWNLADPLFNHFQDCGDIELGGNNIADPEDWFFVPANGR